MVGSPALEELGTYTSDRRLDRFVKELAGRPTHSLAETIPRAPAAAIELLDMLLQFRPNMRISAKAALKHAYMAPFSHDEDDGQVCSVEGSAAGGSAAGSSMQPLLLQRWCSNSNGEVVATSELMREVRRALCTVEAPELDWAALEAIRNSEVEHWSNRYSKQQAGSSEDPIKGDVRVGSKRGLAST